jgi:hypothetical protein
MAMADKDNSKFEVQNINGETIIGAYTLLPDGSKVMVDKSTKSGDVTFAVISPNDGSRVIFSAHANGQVNETLVSPGENKGAKLQDPLLNEQMRALFQKHFSPDNDGISRLDVREATEVSNFMASKFNPAALKVSR